MGVACFKKLSENSHGEATENDEKLGHFCNEILKDYGYTTMLNIVYESGQCEKEIKKCLIR
jgi:hypothetical protein